MNTFVKLGLSMGLFYLGMMAARKVILAYPGDEEGFWDLREASPLNTDLGAAVIGGGAVFLAGKFLPKLVG